ncbi:MAG: hypothetical protein K9G46_08325 [Flavobacteriales bacterium]|nr:hypothetical protein [Flavobacteriales bacterium]
MDISKDWLDVAICADVTEPVTEVFQVENNLKGIGKLIKKCTKLKLRPWVCYSAVPALEIKNSIGVTRGKTDRVDAIRIAVYAATHVHKLKPSKLPVPFCYN